MMRSRTIAIGDIHGCAEALRCLIDAVRPSANDTIVPLGDVIDRGPNSRQAIDLLTDLGRQCHLVPLLGNHEVMMLDALESPSALSFWLECGGCETLESYGGSFEHVPPEHLVFLRSLHRFYETETHLFVHANYNPDLPVAQQPDRLLFWEHIVHTTPAQHVSGKTAIVGHTPQGTGEVLDLGHVICIDTYCFGGGWLTAFDVETGQIWQADRAGRLRT